MKRPVAERTEAAYLTAAQAQALLATIAGDRLEALYRLMLASGLRRGEALALHWSDVDLENGSLRVRGTLSRTSQGLQITEPKTERSRRNVPLPKSAVDTLKAHRKRQTVERLAAGPAWESTDLVFATEVDGARATQRAPSIRRTGEESRPRGRAPSYAAPLRGELPARGRDAHQGCAGAPRPLVLRDHRGHLHRHVAPAQARGAAAAGSMLRRSGDMLSLRPDCESMKGDDIWYRTLTRCGPYSIRAEISVSSWLTRDVCPLDADFLPRAILMKKVR